MSEHLDALETRDPAERETALMAALPAQLTERVDPSSQMMVAGAYGEKEAR